MSMTETRLGWKCPRCGSARSFSERECPDDGVKIAYGFEPQTIVGARLDGKLVLTTWLGSGGFGHVFLATHTETHGARVVKLLRPEHASNPETVTRFRREAQVAESLEHRGIVRVYDTGIVEGVPYIVMERVRGDSLRTILTQCGTVSADRVGTIIQQIADALAFAHDRQVIHRDLTPANVIVRQTPNGSDEITVIDFGLARSLGGGTASALTTRGETVGTAAYMSPEQLGLGTVDHRTDIFALAMLAVEMLAGTLPSRAGSEIPDADLPDPYGITELPAAREWSPALADVLRRGVHPAKRERYQTAVAFAADLAGALSFTPLPSLTTASVSAPPIVETGESSQRSASVAGARRARATGTPAPATTKRKAALVVTIGALVAAAMVGAWMQQDDAQVPVDLEAALQASALPATKDRGVASQPGALEGRAGPTGAVSDPVNSRRPPLPAGALREQSVPDSAAVDRPLRQPASADVAQELALLDRMSRGSVPLAFQAIGRAGQLMPTLTTFDDSVRLRLITAQASLSAGRPQAACIELRALAVTTEATGWQQQVASAREQSCR